MTDTSRRARVQTGVPTGGEFATETRGENSDLETPAQAQHREFAEHLDNLLTDSKSKRMELSRQEMKLCDREVTFQLAKVAAQTRARLPQAKYIGFATDEADATTTAVNVHLKRVLNAEGKVIGSVSDGGDFVAPSLYGNWSRSQDGKRARIDIDDAITAGKWEAERAEFDANKAEAMKRPSVKQMRSQMDMINAIDNEARIEFSEDGQTSQEAVIRHGAWTDDGNMAGHTADPRDAYVRLTMRSGMERWVPFTMLADLRTNERLFFNDHFGQ